MGKKGGGDGGAGQARADEQARQQKIREGTASINSIFDGGKFGADPVAFSNDLDRSKTYYNKDGSVFDWNSSPGSVGGMFSPGVEAGLNMLGVSAPTELYTSVKTTPGFNDDFFKKRGQDYIDYATPQLDRQFGDAKKQLTFSLARSGTLDSSARAQKEGELKMDYDTQDRAVKDQALTLQNSARNDIESARADLIRTLNATGDASGAASSALSRANALSAPTGFSPLGQLFNTFTSGLGTQAALERANAYSGGAVAPRYNTGLFGNSGAVKVS